MKEQKFENYFGRKIAVDASMHIYSFLVSVSPSMVLPSSCCTRAAEIWCDRCGDAGSCGPYGRSAADKRGRRGHQVGPRGFLQQVSAWARAQACLAVQLTLPCLRVALRSHLQGMFFRTARMLESGMKPV